jgi:L-alanine-DL-glutamate epimerase-like enolase superfamily enzyme
MDRREFSKTLAAAATMGLFEGKSILADASPLAAPPLSPAPPASPAAKLLIDRIELFPVRYPMTMRFKFFEGPVSGGGRPAIIIKITAADGTVGWGESVPIPRWGGETPEGALACLKNYLLPVLPGRNVFDLAQLHDVMDKEIANGFSTSYPITKAGIDIALHDLIGKARGRNIAELWGLKTPGDLTLSWTLNPKSLDETAGLIQKGRDRGYRNFNVKVAPDKRYDLELCAQVRKAVPDGFLWADANCGYDTADALEMAPKLAKLGVAVLEGPLHPNNISGYQELRKQGALPIIMDEGCVSPTDVSEFIKLKMMDGIAMKPSRCGGLISAKAQIELLRKAGMRFLGSGLTDPDISLAATLILFGAFGLDRPAALNGPQFLGASVLKQPFAVRDGKIPIPKGPGLGIEVDEAKVRELSARTWRG